ncbi:hypothetical protein I4U23_020274 [Adineta vaga]|nr:hypothetical protein I4U23_020274 [Adineta vaga]
MKSAGFVYTGVGDTARCSECNLEVSEWTREMEPFSIHLERKPDCSFVRSIQQKNESMLTSYIENSAKRHKSDFCTDQCNPQNKFMELENLKQVRRRTFSHWSENTTPLKNQIIDAGFFACNVGDRVICLYCNLVCQQWNKDSDDPVEIHKRLSPKCPYVLLMLKQDETSSAFVLNGMSVDNVKSQETLLNNVGRLHSNHIVCISPCHASYANIISRRETFSIWDEELMPSADDLVKAGFFYTGTKSAVICFYCNGSLQNWKKNDNPLIEHVKWYPHCLYAKQLAGCELYDKIRREQNSREEVTNSLMSTNSSTTNNMKLYIPDEGTLSRLVAARIDLPISQQLLKQNFKQSVIKRCWEDQLRLKQDDFISDCDLYIACIILQKQIEHINGDKTKIIIPSIKIKEIENNEQSNTQVLQQLPLPTSSSSTSILSNTSNQTSATSENSSMQSVTSTNESSTTEDTMLETTNAVNNPCISCNKEEKRLACIPCGHLALCVSCSRTHRTCPTCRRSIEAFVRIYI